MATTNFLQWNPNATNQLGDSQYSANTPRTGGASVGQIFNSNLANKLFFQTTTFCRALAVAMVNKGYDMLDDDINFLISSFSNLLTKYDIGTGAGTVCAGNDSRLMPSGARMWFHMNVAPVGWTIIPGLGDRVLSVAGGTAAYNVAGGGVAGTWVQPSHNHSMTHTHSVSITIGNHNHCIYQYVQAVSNATQSRVYNSAGNLVNMTTNPGASGIAWITQVDGKDYTLPFNAYSSNSGAGTYSGNTGAASSSVTGSTQTATTWRPAANVGIICVKS